MESRETSLFFVMLVLMYLVYDLEAIILGALLICTNEGRICQQLLKSFCYFCRRCLPLCVAESDGC